MASIACTLLAFYLIINSTLLIFIQQWLWMCGFSFSFSDESSRVILNVVSCPLGFHSSLVIEDTDSCELSISLHLATYDSLTQVQSVCNDE